MGTSSIILGIGRDCPLLIIPGSPMTDKYCYDAGKLYKAKQPFTIYNLICVKWTAY